MKLFGEITKVEALEDGAIKVTGVASTGAVDDAEERVLPDAMKAALPAYMRFGALREMHGLSAAGSTLRAEVDEEGATRIEALVVDPVAVRKVQRGVYKGFSIGGKVLARDPHDSKVITKLKLNEISLVDRPCNPEAVIDMWKASAGSGPSNAAVVARAEAMAAAAGKPGRRSDFVSKARQALMQEGDAEDGSEDAPTDDTDHGLADGPDTRTDTDGLTSDLAHIQATHDHMVELGARCQADNCGGKAPPDDGEDSEEDDDGKAWRGDTLLKVLARNARLTDEVAAMGPRIEILQRTIATLEGRLSALAAEPLPPRTLAGGARAVSKAEDVDPSAGPAISDEDLRKYFEGLSEEERGRLQLRAALRQPFVIGR